MSSKSEITLRVYGVLIHDGHVLLSTETYKGLTFTKFPGGGVEHREGLLEALEREFVEELSLSIVVREHLYTTDFFAPSTFDDQVQVLSVYYLIDAPSKRLLTIPVVPIGESPAVDKGEVFHWVPLDSLTPDWVTFETEKAAVRQLLIRY